MDRSCRSVSPWPAGSLWPQGSLGGASHDDLNCRGDGRHGGEAGRSARGEEERRGEERGEEASAGPVQAGAPGSSPRNGSGRGQQLPTGPSSAGECLLPGALWDPLPPWPETHRAPPEGLRMEPASPRGLRGREPGLLACPGWVCSGPGEEGPPSSLSGLVFYKIDLLTMIHVT